MTISVRRGAGWRMPCLAGLVIAYGVVPHAAFAGGTQSADAVQPVTVTASPITSFARFGSEDTGKLAFRGGLVLQSEDKTFGGWSGIVVDEAAQGFLAISDTGIWMTGKMTYDGSRLSGVTDARMGPLLGQDGTKLVRNRYRDAEAIVLEKGTINDGTVLVAFERKARIARYDIGPDGLGAARDPLELPPKLRAMRRNQGFEALTIMKGGPFKGATVAFSERLYDANRNHTGWVWTPKGVEILHLENIGDFDITDIASDSDGALFVLERRFRWTEGVKMRLRRIAPDDLQPDATPKGETLIEADLSKQIDNMEGLALTRTDDGLLITLISDDNLNRTLQRTLLLQFLLADESNKKARAGQ